MPETLSEILSGLERRMAGNPSSGSFAWLASHYLQSGRTADAIALCIEGTKNFPDYSTGHFILGKCYEATGRTVEALLEYRHAHELVPDNVAVQSALKRVEDVEREAFWAFTEERSAKLKERRNSLTVDEYLRQDGDTQETTFDFLLNRLKDVKKITPKPADVTDLVSQPAREEKGAKLVSATLAEIYVEQEAYDEAISAYQRLIEQHPESKTKYERRLEEITLLRASAKPKTRDDQ